MPDSALSSCRIKFTSPGCLIAIAILVWLALLLLTPLLIYQLDSRTALEADTIARLGTWGDTFGFANAAFSGIALILIAMSLYFQRQELLTAMEELKKTSEAMQQNVTQAQRSSFEQILIKLHDNCEQEVRAIKTINFSRFDTAPDGSSGIALLHKLVHSKQMHFSNNKQPSKKFVFLNQPEERDASKYINGYLHSVESMLEFVFACNLSDDSIYRKLIQCLLGDDQIKLLKLFVETSGETSKFTNISKWFAKS